MSKRHFEAMARALRETRPDGTEELRVWRNVVGAIAKECAAENPRFKRDTFFRAAGVTMCCWCDDVATGDVSYGESDHLACDVHQRTMA